MNFFSGDIVDKPCSDVLAHPVQCFQEVFLATPAIVGTFFVGVGGFAVAVAIWGAIFALAVYSLYFITKHIFSALKYIFTQTKVGQTVSHYLPIGKYLQSFCCKAQQVGIDQPKRFINTHAIGDYGANIVSKVHVESKWFKNVFKSIGSKSHETSESSETTSGKSQQKSPSKSAAKLSAFSPKILSPKILKQC